MTQRPRGFTVILVLALLPIATLSRAEDWPAWTGPLGRNVSNEIDLPDSFDRSDMKNVKWVAELGTVAFGCPTVADGRIYIGTNYPAAKDDPRFAKTNGGVLVCLDEATGETLWRLVTPERTQGFHKNAHMIQQRWGICSSPTVDRDRVYIVTNGDDILCLDVNGMKDGNDGPFQDEATFMAREGDPPIELNDTDADIIWRFDIPRELGVVPHDVGSCSILIDGDVLYTSTSNGIGTGSPVYAVNTDAPAFIALDKNTGKLLATENEKISERLFHAQWASPSKGKVGDKSLIFLGGGEGVCYAFEAFTPGQTDTPGLLKTVWSYDCNPPHYKRRNGKRVYYYQGDLRVYKSRKKQNQPTENFNNGDGTFICRAEILSTPVLYNNKIYVATGRDPLHGLGQGILHCIDATQTGDITETGKIWSYEGIGRTLASVAVHDGLVYAPDLQGRLHCLDADTGQVYWIHDTGSELWGSPLVADGKVYVNTKRAFWILAAQREKKVLFTQRGGSETAANGTVYAFMRSKLYALAQESTPRN